MPYNINYATNHIIVDMFYSDFTPNLASNDYSKDPFQARFFREEGQLLICFLIANCTEIMEVCFTIAALSSDV